MDKILDLENDGLNLAVDGIYLYIRCKRVMYKYNLTDMSCSAQNTIFKKDGKSRSLSIGERYIFLIDFCDLYILDKVDLHIVEVKRLGTDLTSDLLTARFDEKKAYISIRNGKMAVMDLNTNEVNSISISDSSSWDFCTTENRIYMGTTTGELIVIDTANMQVINQSKVCSKNIYSVIYHNKMLYIVSQDMSIKALNSNTLEIVYEKKKVVKGMVRILGVCNGNVVVANNEISLFDINGLELYKHFDLPTGHFNKGAVLCGNEVFGSDYHSVYRCTI